MRGLFGARLNFPASFTLPDGSDGRPWTRRGWRAGSETRMGLWTRSFRMLWDDAEHQGCPPGPVEEKRSPARGCWAWDRRANAGLLFGPSMLRTECSHNSDGGNWVCCVLCPSLIKCLLFCALGVNFLLCDVCFVGVGEAWPVRVPCWGL